MKKNFLGFLYLSLFFLSGSSYAEKNEMTTEEYVNRIYVAAQRAWPELETIWDTPVYRKLRLVIADSHNAWAIDCRQLIKIPYSEIQKRHLTVQYEYFQKIDWDDARPTLYISMGDKLPAEEIARFRIEKNPIPSLFSLATHEAFHFFVQAEEWKRPSSEKFSRATMFPVQAGARFFRKSIIKALQATLQGDPDGPGHARYWFTLWRSQTPNDAKRIRNIDVIEGSARYVENAAEAIAQGYLLNTTAYRHAVAEKNKNSGDMLADSESYIIGALSGFIMDMRKMTWQPDVINGVPPLEVLLANVTPITQPKDDKMFSEVNAVAAQLNAKFGPAITQFRQHYNNPQIIKLVIGQNKMGSFSVNGGFFQIEEIPYDIMVGFSAKGEGPNGSYHVKDTVAIHIDNSGGPSEDKGTVFYYPGTLPAAKNGRLILDTEKLTLNIPYPHDVAKTNVIRLP